MNSKSSFIISGRFTPLSYLALLAEKWTTKNINFYHFYDFTGKFNYKLTKKDKIYLSVYTGRDMFKTKFEYDDAQDAVSSLTSFKLQWGNKIALLRYNRQWSKKVFSNLSLVYSKYQMISGNEAQGADLYKNEIVNYKKKENYSSGLNDLGLLFNVDAQLSNKYFLKFGSSVVQKEFFPKAIEYSNVQQSKKDTLYDNLAGNKLNIKAIDFRSYIENHIKLLPNLNLNIGIHFNTFYVEDTSYYSIEPRLSLSYSITPNLALKTSYSRMTQEVHLLGNSGVGFPTDIWVPSTKKIKPESADQLSIGLYTQWLEKWQATVEAYYKELKNVVDFSQGTNFLKNGHETDLLNESDASWQDRLFTGKGQAYGIEFYLKRETPKWITSISYTYSKSWRKFSQINRGQSFPFRYNRDHVFNFDFSYKINAKLSVTEAWQYMSGYFVSLPVRKYFGRVNSEGVNYDYVITEKSSKNNFQSPAYHRLDIGISYKKTKKQGTAIWNFGVYNAYNRQNTYAIIPMGVSLEQITQISLFPILPSISYRFIFN